MNNHKEQISELIIRIEKKDIKPAFTILEKAIARLGKERTNTELHKCDHTDFDNHSNHSSTR